MTMLGSHGLKIRAATGGEWNARRSTAMTLVELLVVITVILLLMAVAIPAIAPTVRENRLREASRQMSVLVARAKARSGELGRRVALWLERSAPGSNAVLDVYLAEAPSEYSGDYQGARCLLYYDPTPAVRRWRLDFTNVPTPYSTSLIAPDASALVRNGESFKIRFSGRGPWFDGYRDTSSGQFFLRPPPAVQRLGQVPPDVFVPPAGFFDPGTDGNWGVAGQDDDGNGVVDDLREAGILGASDESVATTLNYAIGATYQIQLIPRRISSSRLQLPEGTAIDLGFSGMGVTLPFNRAAAPTREVRYGGLEFDVSNTTGAVATNQLPVLIIFSPSGEIDSVIYDATTFEPIGPVHLLIGMFDQVVPQDNSPNTPVPLPWSTADSTGTTYDKNISDVTTLWVSIGDRSGTVTTAENGWEIMGSPPNFYDSLRRAREFAQRAQTMGGR